MRDAPRHGRKICHLKLLLGGLEDGQNGQTEGGRLLGKLARRLGGHFCFAEFEAVFEKLHEPRHRQGRGPRVFQQHALVGRLWRIRQSRQLRHLRTP